MNPTGKRIVITGGSIGIGLELAKALIAEGAQVLVCARNRPALEAAQQNTPSLAIAQCDVARDDQVSALLETARSTLGGVDVLINNAAVFRRLDILERSTLESQLEEIDINLKGPVRVTGVFLPELLRSEEPIIVNLTSALGYAPMAAAPTYSATKAAINSWTISLRHQLRHSKARVVLLSPPVVDTRMNADNPDVEGMKIMTARRSR
ncbi:MAG: SDR family NAD(P)-dependent oxidoreductase [Myxococcota bacterium]